MSRAGGAPAGMDHLDGRRVAGDAGILRAFSDATVLEAADVHTAATLGRLVGGAHDDVLLAAALAVRAVRLGHVYVDLATVAGTAAPDDEELDTDVANLPWPDPEAWPALVGTSPLAAGRPLRLVGSRLYLDRYWRHERSVADDLLRRSGGDQPLVDRDVLASGLSRLFGPPPAAPADDLQRLAAATAVTRRFSVVAGGPGTGKTTTVARIVALLHEQATASGSPPPRVALAAPTGKAAARLAEAVHAEAAALDTDPAIRRALIATSATTLHRLLGWQPGSRSRFRHDASNPLSHSVVIVDESSMVPLTLMARLLAAVRPNARLVLVGDPRQLASVEAGAVLGDIVGPAATIPAPAYPAGGRTVADGIVVLRRVHRFGAGVAAVAEAIDSGDADAAVAALRAAPPDVAWIEVAPDVDLGRSPQLAAVRAAVVEAATAVVACARTGDGRGALAALGSVQVLCAHRRGAGGAAAWRAEIEHWLRPAIPGYGGRAWFAGQPLLVTENDHGLGVFNGDTAVIVDTGGGRLRAVFDRRGQLLMVPPARLSAVEPLSAMTIHKAQGSQFGAVVVALPSPSSRILTRELLYTAVTRAQASLTVVASEASVRAAVTRPIARASGLGEALWRHG